MGQIKYGLYIFYQSLSVSKHPDTSSTPGPFKPIGYLMYHQVSHSAIQWTTRHFYTLGPNSVYLE